MKHLKILKKRKRYQLKILIGFMEAISSFLVEVMTELKKGEKDEQYKRRYLGRTQCGC